jgi:hypothetical protein
MGVYFLLIEDQLKVRPSYGFIVLGDGTRHRIENLFCTDAGLSHLMLGENGRFRPVDIAALRTRLAVTSQVSHYFSSPIRRQY